MSRIIAKGNVKLNSRLGAEARKALWPFEGEHGVWGHQIIKSNLLTFGFATQAVEIDVVESHSSGVGLHQGEGGAVHDPLDAKPPGQAFDKLSLARPERAGEQKHVATSQEAPEGLAKGEHLIRAADGPVGNHVKILFWTDPSGNADRPP